MEYEIRKATGEDIERINNIMNTIAEGMEHSDYFVSSDLDYITSHIEDAGITYLVLGDDNVMGFLIIDIPGECEHNLGLDIGLGKQDLAGVVHMDTIVVLPEYRGQGLQKIMLRYGEERMKERGCTDFMATVHPNNTASLKSFLDNGYDIQKTKLKYYGYLRHILHKRA